jgi:hypothetical protein
MTPQGAMIDVDSILGVCEADYLAADPDGTVYPLREE